MLTLYYSPGACSLSVHIALCENDFKYNLKKVDLATKKVADGSDFNSVNPKSYVPTIVLEDGTVLTECAAIQMYLTEQSGKLPSDPIDRFKLYEALTFVSSELHKSIGAFFDPKLQGEYRDKRIALIKKRLDVIENKLSKAEFLAGNTYTAADGYCFAILRWLKVVDTGIDTTAWPQITAYLGKIAARPKVKQAMEEEGLES